MNLLRIEQPEIEIPTPGGSFTVQGIGVLGAVELLTRNWQTMPLALKALTEGKAIKVDNSAALGMELLISAPGLLADIIATAAGGYTPDTFEAARRLPISSALLALEAIASLTFSAAGGPKEFLALVMGFANGATGMVVPPSHLMN